MAFHCSISTPSRNVASVEQALDSTGAKWAQTTPGGPYASRACYTVFGDTHEVDDSRSTEIPGIVTLLSPAGGVGSER